MLDRREAREGNAPSSPAAAATLLEVRGLGLRFGGLQVLTGVNLDVRRGAIHGLCGPNGAGKTSLFNCVSGLYRAERGTIRLDAADIGRRPAHALAGLGLARTFQHPCLDGKASVLENVLVGAHCRARAGVVAGALRWPAVRRGEAAAQERALALLDSLGLAAQARRPAGVLPFGSQKRVELCRALLIEPRLLLLDEPASGLTHGEIDELAALMLRLRSELGLTLLVVEHHMGLVSRVTDAVTVLVEGRVVAEGPAAAVQRDPRVVEAYLGAPA